METEYPHILGMLFLGTVLYGLFSWIPAHIGRWWRMRNDAN